MRKAEKEDIEYCVSHLGEIRKAAQAFIELTERMPIALRHELENALEAVPLVKKLENTALLAQKRFEEEIKK